MAAEDQEQRTEEATPKRQREQRDQGMINYSRDLSSMIVLFIALSALWVMCQRFAHDVALFTSETLNEVAKFNMSRAGLVWDRMLTLFVSILAPFLAIIVGTTLVTGFIQIGLPLSLDPWTNRLGKINFLGNFKRIFSPIEASKNLLKSFVKGFFVMSVAYVAIRKNWLAVFEFAQMEPFQALMIVLTILKYVAVRVVGLMIVWGAFDYIMMRRRNDKSMRMTKQEVKDEHKEEQGSPMVKNKLKSMQAAMARQLMLKEVKKADVIVVNPTHYAVALRYASKRMGAPRVVAKGVDHMAQKIREVARKNSVPIVENKPLARTLYAQVRVGKEIPEALYKAVAEVLAYIYRNRSRRLA